MLSFSMYFIYQSFVLKTMYTSCLRKTTTFIYALRKTSYNAAAQDKLILQTHVLNA